jgi:hypothetical protein
MPPCPPTATHGGVLLNTQPHAHTHTHAHTHSWVRRELHCWVFSNVRAKWPAVLRRPLRLPQLFSGYHADEGLVAAVLKAAGVHMEVLAAEAAARGVRERLRVRVCVCVRVCWQACACELQAGWGQQSARRLAHTHVCLPVTCTPNRPPACWEGARTSQHCPRHPLVRLPATAASAAAWPRGGSGRCTAWWHTLLLPASPSCWP